MAIELAPCNWDAIACGCSLEAENGDEAGALAIAYAVETAQFILWALSGRQFGCCEISARPCKRDCSSSDDGAWGARLRDGQWINLPCRSCAGPCYCAEICEIRLPETPVCDIYEVILDGVVVDQETYRVEDSSWLVLTTGCFPNCQDMAAPLGAEGTYGVRYGVGVMPPVAGRRAVGALACEILKACRQDSSCCLPKRTQSFNRQGISAILLDPMEFFERGRTGIYEVDLFLNAVNPLHRMAGARVISPDWPPRSRIETWPPEGS